MFKKIIAISSLVIFAVPLVGLAQNTPNVPTVPLNIDLKNLPDSLPAPISDFANKLKGIFNGGSIGNISVPSGEPNMSLSDVGGTWASINNWFVSKIGISLTDIIKTIANLIIWFWELVIKLIQTGLSYL
jgi:hypothetical protein